MFQDGPFFFRQNLCSGISRWTADNTFRLFQNGAFKLSGSDWRVNYVGTTINDIHRIVIIAAKAGPWSPANPAAIAGGFNVVCNTKNFVFLHERDFLVIAWRISYKQCMVEMCSGDTKCKYLHQSSI